MKYICETFELEGLVEDFVIKPSKPHESFVTLVSPSRMLQVSLENGTGLLIATDSKTSIGAYIALSNKDLELVKDMHKRMSTKAPKILNALKIVEKDDEVISNEYNVGE